jgi:hypothetical protein
VIEYELDVMGNRVQESVYDALGRVTSKTQTVNAGASSKAFTLGYAYGSGRQTGITYPSGRIVSYGFNAQVRIPVMSGRHSDSCRATAPEHAGPV